MSKYRNYAADQTTYLQPLNGSIIPTVGNGGSFTRATIAGLPYDHEGKPATCLSGEARFPGLRRIHNILTVSSEDNTQGSATSNNATTPSTTTVNLSVGSNSWWYRSGGSATIGKSYVARGTISCASPTQINVRFVENGTSNQSYTTITAGPTPQVVSLAIGPCTTTGAVIFGLDTRVTYGAGNNAATYTFTNIQIEDTTGRYNMTASEYVPVGRPKRNEFLQTENLGMNTPWVQSNTPQIVPDGTLGGACAWRITDSITTGYQYITQTLTVANDSTTRYVGIRIKKESYPTSTFGINVNLSGGTPVSAFARLNINTGTSPYTGAFTSVVDRGAYWECYISITNNTSGNTTLSVGIYPAAGVFGAGVDNVAGMGSVTIAAPWVSTVNNGYFPVGASYPFHGAGVDGVRYSDRQNANRVDSTGILTEVTGAQFPSSGIAYAYLPGLSSNNFMTPDAPFPTGPLDIRIHCAAADWTPTSVPNVLVSKWEDTGNQHSILWQLLTTGALQFYWSVDGINPVSCTSSATISAADGSAKWLRVTLESDGSTGSNVKFYTSDDGTVWTQLGTTQNNAAAPTIFDSTSAAPLYIGLRPNATANVFNGTIMRMQVYKGLGNSALLSYDFDPNLYVSGTTMLGHTGETWTLSSAAKIRRWPWGYLPEESSTNIVLHSETFGTTWAASVGTPTRAANAKRCGGLILELLTDDDAGISEAYSQAITFTGDGTKAVSFFFAQGTAVSSVVRIRDDTVPATRMIAEITWSNGVPTVTCSAGGILLGVDAFADGVFRARCQATGVVAANGNSVYVYIATDSGLTVAGTGNAYFGGIQVENKTYCTSYIPTTTATVTRNADQLVQAVSPVIGASGTASCEVYGGSLPANNPRILSGTQPTDGAIFAVNTTGEAVVHNGPPALQTVTGNDPDLVPMFEAKLLGSVINERGYGAVSYNRATVAGIPYDYEGKYHQALSGEMRFAGLRRVSNLAINGAFTSPLGTTPPTGWVRSTVGTSTFNVVNSTVFPGETAIEITVTAGAREFLQSASINVPLGAQYRISCYVESSTGNVGHILFLANSTAVVDNNCAITGAGTLPGPGRYVGQVGTVTTGGTAFLRIGINCASAGTGDATIRISRVMLEEVTHQASQAPSEYVSNGGDKINHLIETDRLNTWSASAATVTAVNNSHPLFAPVTAIEFTGLNGRAQQTIASFPYVAGDILNFESDLKADDLNGCALFIYDSLGSNYASYAINLTTGVVSGNGQNNFTAVTATSTSLGDGWWRMRLTATASASGTSIICQIRENSTYPFGAGLNVLATRAMAWKGAAARSHFPVGNAYQWHGAMVDGVKYFNTTNGNTVASNIITELTGQTIPAGGFGNLYLPGNTSSYLTTPHSTTNSVTGDIELTACLVAADYTPGTITRIITKGNATRNYDWNINASGNMEFYTTTVGSVVTSTVTFGTTQLADSQIWLRVRRRASTGVIQFYTSQNGITWTQLGTDVNATAGALTFASDTVYVGIYPSLIHPFTGTMRRVQVRSGFESEGGTLVLDMNPTNWTTGSTFFGGVGELWTMAGGAAVRKWEQGGVIEESTVNICLQSEDFANATWLKSGTPITTSAAKRLGDITLDLLNDDDAAAAEYYEQTITFTGDAVKAVSIYFAQGTATNSVIQLRDSTAAADRLKAEITWTNGIPSLAFLAGSLLTLEALADNIWRARMVTTAVTAANTNALRIQPANTNAGNVALTGTIYFGGVQVENKGVVTTYVKTTTASVTRNGDTGLGWQLGGNGSETSGVLYGESLCFDVGGTASRITGGLSDAGTSNRHTVGQVHSAGTADNGLTVVAGSSTGSVDSGAIVANVMYNRGYRYQVDAYQQIRNGVMTSIDTTGATPTGLTHIAIGAATPAGASPLNGIVRNFKVFGSGSSATTATDLATAGYHTISTSWGTGGALTSVNGKAASTPTVFDGDMLGSYFMNIGFTTGTNSATFNNLIRNIKITAGQNRTITGRSGTVTPQSLVRYVDSVAGSNANNGSIASPWADFTNVLTSVAPGMMVFVKRGSVIRQSFNPTVSGTKTAPITLQAYGTGNAPLLLGSTNVTGTWNLVSGTEYRIASALTLSANIPIYWVSTAGVVTRLERGTAGALTTNQCAIDGAFININIGSNPNGAGSAEVPTRSACVMIDGVSNYVIQDVETRYSSNDGVSVRNGADNVRVYGVVSTWNANDGFNVFTKSTNLHYERCIGNDNGRTIDDLGDGFSAHVDSSGVIRNCEFRRNFKNGVSNSEQGTWYYERVVTQANNGGNIAVYSETGVAGFHVFNRCVMYDGLENRNPSAIYWFLTEPNNGSSIYLYNSTIVRGTDVNTIPRGIRVAGNAGNVVIRNVIVSGTFTIGLLKAGTSTIDHNYMQINGSTTAYSGTSTGANSITTAPIFYSEATGDFRLHSTSPGINSGVAITGFTEGYGGAAPDMGAFEVPNVSATFANRYSWRANFEQGSIAPERGTAALSFTRATPSVVTDFEGKAQTTVNWEARFQGMRRVRNLHPSSDATPAPTVVRGTATWGAAAPDSTLTAIICTATSANGYFYSSVTSPIPNPTITQSMWLRRRTGTGPVYFIDNSTGSRTAITSRLTTTWQRLAVTTSGLVTNNAFGGIEIATSGDEVDLWHPQIEDVTTQSNQNPSEYVSTGYIPPLQNELLNTENPTSWVVISGAGSRSAVTGPDGLATATRITRGTGDTTVRLSGTRVVATGTIVSGSIWIRKVSGSGTYVDIDLNDGVTGATITYDWVKYNATNISTFSGIAAFMDISLTTANGWATGDIIEVWHPQYNLGATVNAYAPVGNTHHWHGAGVDGIKYFNTTNGNTVTNNIVTEAAGEFIPKIGLNHGVVAGTATAGFSFADTSGRISTGTVNEFEVEVTLNTVVAGACLIAKDPGATPRSFIFRISATGGLELVRSIDSVNTPSYLSTATLGSVGIVAGIRAWLKAVHNATTGTCQFFYSLGNRSTYVQLGTDVSGTAGNFYASDRTIVVGARNTGLLDVLNGTIRRALITRDGSVVLDFDPNNWVSGSTFTTGGETCTILGGAAIRRWARGYLPEEGTTNICLQSEDFGTTWVAGGTPTRSAGAKRCGSVLLDLIGDDDATALESYTQQVTFTGDAVKAVSFYFAQGTATTSAFRVRDATAAADRLGGAITWSNSAPVVTMTVGTLSGVDALGGGIWRVRMVTTSVTAANINQMQIFPACQYPLTTGETGNLYVGGVQLENKAYCTSYMKTTTATVTRNADVLTHGNVFLYPTAYSGYYEAATTNTAVARAVLYGTDGTATELVQAYLNSATPPMPRMAALDNNVQQADIASLTASTENVPFKFSFRAEANNFGCSFNGAAVQTDPLGTMPSVHTLWIGHNNGGAQVNNVIQDAKIWNEAASNTDLVSLTT